MQVMLKATDAFAPGFQRFHLLQDRMFRLAAVAYPCLAALTIVLNEIHSARPVWDLVIYLLFLMPVGVSMAGGAPRAAYMWWVAFCALWTAAAAPLFHGAGMLALLPAAPALYCLWRAHRAAPHILKAFGYNENIPFRRELLFSLIPAMLLILVTHFASTRILHYSYSYMGVENYLFLICRGMPCYAVTFGLMYGLLMRRLLNMRMEIVPIIIINVVLFVIQWVPVSLVNENPVDALAGTVGTAFAIQISLGLAFLFCRSTRMILLAYMIYYVFYKSLGVG